MSLSINLFVLISTYFYQFICPYIYLFLLADPGAGIDLVLMRHVVDSFGRKFEMKGFANFLKSQLLKELLQKVYLATHISFK